MGYCLSEEAGDIESEEEEEERDPVPEVTEVRFIPDDANSCESLYRSVSVLSFKNIFVYLTVKVKSEITVHC